MTVTERKRKKNPYQPVGRWIRPEKRQEIYWRDDFRCFICRKDLCGVPAFEITLDHFVPVSEGGSNAAINLYTCCRSCNSRRGVDIIPRKHIENPLNEILDAWFYRRLNPYSSATRSKASP